VPCFGSAGEGIAKPQGGSPAVARGATPLCAPVAFSRAGGYGEAMSGTRFSPAGALALFAATLALMPAAQAARHTRHHAAHVHKRAPAGVKTLGSAGAWTAYDSHESSGRVCYIASEPEKAAPSGVARKQPMAMVALRPAENAAKVVSFVAGYPLKPDSNVVLEIDGHKFTLFPKDDAAWARTSDLDRTIIAALAKGRTAVARGEPQRGHPTADVYSLAGFSKALAMIDKACGGKSEKAAAPRSGAASQKGVKHHHAEHHEAHR
jgi:Invasion associated locus B (IalB) protein